MRQKGTYPSQPVAKPRDARSTPYGPAQINTIHTLRSGKEVDNQAEQTNPSLTKPFHPLLAQTNLKRTKLSRSLPTYEPPTPFPNRPNQRNTQDEILKQVKVNVPLQCNRASFIICKFLKDLCTKKRAHQAPKNVCLQPISVRSFRIAWL